MKIEEYSFDYGIPLHNSPYLSKTIDCRFNLIQIELEVQNPEIIKDIIPYPLSYVDNKIILSMNKVCEYKGGFPAYMDNLDWSEFLIQVPVELDGNLFTYNCEGFVNNPVILLVNREVFGYPKILSDIEIFKNGNDFEGVAKYFKTDKKIFSISFKSQRKGTPADVGEKRGLINLKVIPSAENNKEPEVKQLIVTQYKKQKVNNLEVGEGAVQLHDFAPEYLKKAGIKRVVKSLFLELELIVDGGKIIYNYKSL